MRYELRPQDERCELYRIEEDGTEVLLGSDRGEPEDNDFRRDWAWVPGELDRLAAEIATLKREKRAVKARLQAFVSRWEEVWPDERSSVGDKLVDWIDEMFEGEA